MHLKSKIPGQKKGMLRVVHKIKVVEFTGNYIVL